ncbi:nucleotidyl transferase AbiEii/AbiGii toxin family protein [Marinobacter sp. 1_MG-2023]|uniref:nucleotidyl transferase AbiEii/AbiGii toxin family protein n=1 Tax=Marinobacter sp. 1_MG-2023 TaxID=3062627 RepID=UPI0026E25676|nr:nucleotidyl transferase AbiEii/AbiGii toxin family protein [Marinobacter sp. 1_MG-2023]MDO6824657.1 nucleotidyl transferase AbiEii/AbiGii toxin family protein [Marinobacter sp. 1_MG-2023]
MAKNIAASVRQKLLNKSREEKRPFQELLQYYAMERFLYRLSQSPHSGCFTLKGALMLWAIQGPSSRPTRDIDMLGQTSNEPEAILAQVRDVIAAEVVDDGLRFDPDTLKVDSITEDADYQGLRVAFTGFLDNARIPMQLDIGFGDPVFPFPSWLEFPALLDFPTARIQCYTPESSIAEKFQAMVNLGELNSRMKDFYDIWLLSRQHEFRLENLMGAVERTFHKRGTGIPETSPFSAAFVESKQPQWQAFCKRLGQPHVPDAFMEVVTVVTEFLAPVMAGKAAGTSEEVWHPPGPWSR